MDLTFYQILGSRSGKVGWPGRRHQGSSVTVDQCARRTLPRLSAGVRQVRSHWLPDKRPDVTGVARLSVLLRSVGRRMERTWSKSGAYVEALRPDSRMHVKGGESEAPRAGRFTQDRLVAVEMSAPKGLKFWVLPCVKER